MNYLVRTSSIAIVSVLALVSMTHMVFSASRVDELKNKIEERNNQLETLEEEIAEYTVEIQKIAGEKRTLQSAIQELSLTERRLTTDLRVTEGNIETTNLSLEKLSIEIDEHEELIAKSKDALAKSLRTVNTLDSQTLVEAFLKEETLSEVWEIVDRLRQFQIGLQSNLDTVKELRNELSSRKNEEEHEKDELISLQGQLSGQRSVIASNKQEKDQLLSIKENDEASYERLIDEKKRLREEFQRELQDFEAQLQIELDPDAIPDAGALFNWPVDSVIITQHFGGTEFAKRNPQVYGRPFHNGTDFGIPTGSKVYSVIGGVVTATGDTDIFPSCLSYGKWILVNHQNGLSTLYAHLSHISVAPGQQVSRGAVIGFSGNTGYSTGPHLHFTVYQTEGVRVVRLGDVKTRTNCADAQIPVAPFDAYLDPLQYLPEI